MLRRKSVVVPTVLLELVWVLASGAKWSRARIVAAVGDLLTIATLTVVDREAVEWAVERFATGADFADMLHLALSGEAAAFATFDQNIARFADTAVVAVETLA